MITKAQVLDLAERQDLRPTTVEKDYVLGWLLTAISQHAVLSRWVFKGGTCLKKCFFDTYRFSEDLDFTIPQDEALSEGSIASGLREVADWAESEAGIQFPRDEINVEKYTNPRGRDSFQAKISYVGPLKLPRMALQRVKFDLTQDELLADQTDLREIFHPYDDGPSTPPRIRCYSVDEILAEKSRALYERQGRARDVYDTVHLSRDFRESIDPAKASSLLKQKFAFKGLPEPTVESIVARVEAGTLRVNWDQQLAHQLPKLPPVDSFLDDLPDAIAWWFDPGQAKEPLPAVPSAAALRLVPRQHFPAARQSLGRGRLPSPNESSLRGFGPFDRIRYAARNRLCAQVRYHGLERVVEPYSLRYPSTGIELLYVYELMRGQAPSNGIKSFKLEEIEDASITDRPFTPRYAVEL